MKRNLLFSITAILALVLMAAGPAIPAAAADFSAKTYTVMVGAENIVRGTSVMAYFPGTLRIHVGDTVIWKQNTHEIHTVTFLAGEALPALIIPVPDVTPPLPGPLMLNPQVAFPVAPADGMYDGSTYANSGIMSTDPGNPTQFSLTFTKVGTFNYVCVVHGVMMSGKIVVVKSSKAVLSPAMVTRQAKRQMASKLMVANTLIGVAMSKVPKPVQNSDGSTTFTVLLGWNRGQYELMRFFPRKLTVHPGDTVNFMLSKTNDAPHTVTFYNGAPDISFVMPVPNPAGPPYLLINPELLGPIQPGVPLSTSGIFSSGLMSYDFPGPTSWSLTIGDTSGDFPYDCAPHDTSGMTGMLRVVPK